MSVVDWFKNHPFPPKFARRFSDGGAARSIYAKPNGPRSNPLTDIRGNGGHYVLRSMEALKPAIALPGNTLTHNSVAGIASTVFFQGQETANLFDPNSGQIETPTTASGAPVVSPKVYA